MKALKLKGWVDGIVGTRSKAEITSANWFTMKVVPDMARATLVIGEERVFTESEVRASAMAEPELPDEMPDEMWEACKSDRATMQEALRVVVRLTRDGILGRLLDPA